ncbi:MAG: hypothetical protein IJW92_01610 [Clostridia bacterium]|nr:hypothetical protein [Clostridia bacterium]
MKQNQNSDSAKARDPKTAPATPEPEKKAPKKAMKASADGKGKPNTTLPPPSSAPDFRKETVKHPTGASPAKTTVAPPKAANKKARYLHHIPLTTLPEDESLDEALDDMIEDTSVEEIPVDAPEEVTVTGESQNIFRRIKERRQRQAEQNMTTLELIRKKSGLSEDDIAMLFELGYESELGRLVGYDNLRKLKYEHLHRISSTEHKRYRTAFGYCGEEYIGTSNKQKIIATYLHDRKFLILRTVLTALATVLLLFLDIPHLIGGVWGAIATDYPLLFPLISMGILIAISALSWRQLNAGIRSYLKFTPTPYSVPAIILPIVLIYDIVTLLLQREMLTVNFLATGILLLISLCDVLRLVCEMRTFRILAAEGEKTVLEETMPRKKKLRHGKKLFKVINDDIDEKFYRVAKAELVTGCFRRFNDMGTASFPFHIFLGGMLALSVLAAFVGALYTGSFSAGLSLFMTVLMVCAPCSAVFSFFYPLCRANKLLSYYNCALIGEETVDEYDASKTVIFHDTDLYSAEKCTEISVRESEDLRRDLRLAGILFRKIGGTLESIGNTSLSKAPDPPTALVRITDSGIEAVVDNQYHMIAGSADFLRKSGIRIPKESSDKALRRTENVSLMYVAIDGVLKLSYEIEYNAKASFEETVGFLADMGTAIAVQSYDPNLSEKFVQDSRLENATPVRVIKPGKYEADNVLQLVDSGAVALGQPSDIVYPLHAAKAVSDNKLFAWRFQLVSSCIAAITIAVLTLLNMGGYIGALSVAAYQVLCILISLLASQLHLNKRSLHFRKKKNNHAAQAQG